MHLIRRSSIHQRDDIIGSCGKPSWMPRYVPEVIRDMGLAVASFDRAHEPEGVSTMEWGTRTAIDTYRKLHNRVPDVVYDLGAVGKEPMVRLLAHRAVDAAGLGVEIAEGE